MFLRQAFEEGRQGLAVVELLEAVGCLDPGPIETSDNLDADFAVNDARPDLDEWVANSQARFHEAVDDPVSVTRDKFVQLARDELAVEPASSPGRLARWGIRR